MFDDILVWYESKSMYTQICQLYVHVAYPVGEAGGPWMPKALPWMSSHPYGSDLLKSQRMVVQDQTAALNSLDSKKI